MVSKTWIIVIGFNVILQARGILGQFNNNGSMVRIVPVISQL